MHLNLLFVTLKHRCSHLVAGDMYSCWCRVLGPSERFSDQDLLSKWWIRAHWIILVCDAQHVDHVWIAEHSIFLQDLHPDVKLGATCKNLSPNSRLQFQAVDVSGLFWRSRTDKRPADKIKVKSRECFYWDDEAARDAERPQTLLSGLSLFLICIPNYIGSCQLNIWLELWIRGIIFTATMHQLFPVRDAEAVLLCSKLIRRRVS